MTPPIEPGAPGRPRPPSGQLTQSVVSRLTPEQVQRRVDIVTRIGMIMIAGMLAFIIFGAAGGLHYL